MSTFAEKVETFLTPKRRRRIYAIVAVLGGIFVAHGIVSTEDMSAALQVIGLAIGVVAVPAMAAKNTNPE